MKELKNLKKVIEELNAPTVYEDGEALDSLFEFKIRKVNTAGRFMIAMSTITLII